MAFTVYDASVPIFTRMLTSLSHVMSKGAAFAEARGRSLLELAMSWLAQHRLVVSIITGATRPEQLDQNVKAVGWKPTPEELAEVDKITA